ncbi:hypothetical protein HON01_11425, partial [Candidatus Woesearchaeota archaeon]|nr:hypothetical protein [Candidatus Woesearchaeota archaeon]
MEILEQGFEKIKKGKGFGSIEKYRWYNNYMLKEISLPDVYNPFYDKIPIFVNGLCVTQHNKPRKEGMDPYSNTHRFSTLLIQSLEQLFPPDFLERFLFVYVQPVPFVQKITKHKGKLCLEDIIRHPIEHHVNKNLAEKKKQGFGTLIKSDDSSYKIANAHYDPKLFNFNMFKIANAQNPDSKTREAMKSGRSFNKFLEIK